MVDRYVFLELDQETRGWMLAELDADITAGSGPYVSTKSLTPRGQEDYPELLRAAIEAGDELTLVGALEEFDRTVDSPADAALKLGRTEFNRYYIRGICLRAQFHGTNSVTVYRAHQSDEARVSSDVLEGREQFAPRILENLRGSQGGDPETRLGLVNSGISVRCGCTACRAAQP